MAQPTFSERLATRQRVWWEVQWRRPGAVRDWVHLRRELHLLRGRDEPEAAWRCCALWQRSVLNKWNGREFAARHGCPVPELYWHGTPRAGVPVDSLPSSFVVRPVRGHSRLGVLVVDGEVELLSGESIPRAALGRQLSRAHRLRHPMSVLIEERLFAGGEHRLPLECKCHVFGSEVAAMELIERAGGDVAPRHRYYTPDWEPFPDLMDPLLADDPVREPLDCLAEVLGHARTLGSQLGTYMRIDLFATDRGCVFNEFSSVPSVRFTPYYDEFFGAVWARTMPDAT